MASYPGGDFRSFRLCAVAAVLSGLFVCCLQDAGAESVSVEAVAAVALQDTLVVTGKGLADPLPAGTTGLVTRVPLGPEAMAEDLATTLATVAGLQFRRFGGSGAGAVPSLRGSSPAQVKILVDGFVLDDAESGLFDLSRLPPARFVRADVYRGLVPVAMGAVAGAGAINLITAPGAAGLQVTAGYGSFQDRWGRLVWGTGASPDRAWNVTVGAHARRIANDYTYNDHLQTFQRSDDDTLAIRRNARWEDWGLWSRAGWSGGDWRLRGSLGFYRRDGGRPGPMGAPTPDATVSLRSGDGRLSAKWRDGLVAIDATARRDEEYLHDDQGEVLQGFQGTVNSVARDYAARLAVAPTLISGPGRWISHLAATAGCQWRHQDFRQRYNDLVNPLRTRQTWSLFAAGDLGLAAERIQVSPAWRWRRARDDFPPLPPFYYLDTEQGTPHISRASSPSLAAVGEILPGTLFLRAQWSRSERQPTWIELFGHRGGMAGNRELRSERITSHALGLTWQPDAVQLTLRATAFLNNGTRTIVYVQNSPGTSRPLNIGASETRGLELELNLSTAAMDISANGTWQRARDTSGIRPYDGHELPYLPPAEVWSRIARRGGAWRPYLSFAWQDGDYRDRANTQAGRAPARTVAGAGLSWWPRGEDEDRFKVEAGVENLTDNDVYDVEGFPLPGRSWHVVVEARY